MELTANEFTAYMAGLFDGEGSFCLQLLKGGSSYNLRAEIKLTNKQKSGTSCLDMAASVFGGSTHVNKGGFKSWAITGKKCEIFVRACLPYFNVKAEQAKVVIRYFELAETMRVGHYCKWDDSGRKVALLFRDEIASYSVKPSSTRK